MLHGYFQGDSGSEFLNLLGGALRAELELRHSVAEGGAMSRCQRWRGVQSFSCIALFVLLISSAAFGGIYPSPVNVAVTGADAVAVGDFNGDGKLDIVVADGATSTVEVVLNSGTGTVGSVVSSGMAALYFSNSGCIGPSSFKFLVLS